MREKRNEIVFIGAVLVLICIAAISFFWASGLEDQREWMKNSEVTKECVIDVKRYSPGELNTMQTDYIYEYTLSPSGNKGKSRVPVTVGDTFYFHQVILRKCEK